MMAMRRREFIIGGAAAAAVAATARVRAQDNRMYGLIGKMIAAPGQRDALVAILLEGTAAMPGCLSYVIARDAGDDNAIWITEVWDGKASHAASLTLPAVKEAIARARPLIAGFGERFETTPAGGHGLAAAKAG
jgi:quinol monooxygenase YgiN